MSTTADAKCFVLFAGAAGLVLIMDAAQPLAESDHANLLDRREFPDWDYIQFSLLPTR
jgi:hypothetical protein